jgi:hypothetical protein
VTPLLDGELRNVYCLLDIIRGDEIEEAEINRAYRMYGREEKLI